MESFSKFYPLFLESVNDKKIGVCRWIESGTSIWSAVPELVALTEDKPDWRAVIVHMHDELAMSGFSRNAENPYDFDICRSDMHDNSRDWDKSVPLIRLTQILGGIPAPGVEFEPEEIIEEGKEPRIIYKPKENKEEEELHKQLTEKYYYDGKHPSEIILITIRRKVYKQKDDVKHIWQINDGLKNSEFWKVNRYPGVCRFLFYETERQGSVVESADIFKFWASVMLLSVNGIDPSSLQGYRLYRLNMQMKGEEIKNCFQETFCRLIGARSFINESIQQEAGRTENLDELLPDYKIKVPVVLKKPKDKKNNDKSGVNPSAFKMTVNLTETDMHKWNKMKRIEDDKTRAELKSAEQSLDQTADKVRDHLTFSESRLFRVDKYQVKDIEENLDAVYNNILRLQSELPRESLAYDGELKETDGKVRGKITERIIRSQAVGGFIVPVILALLLIIPTLYFYINHGHGSIAGIIILLALCIFLPLVIELLTLLFHRMKLRRAVRKYRSIHNKLMMTLHDNVTLYSDYMSDIATHARGSSFLRTVRQQKLLKEHSYSAKQRHIKDINHFISYIDDWGTAFYCPVKFDLSKEKEIEPVYIDTEVPSNLNPFYTFEYKISPPYQVPLNNTGDMLNSPVGFIDRILIEREELYDDD